MTTQTPWTAVSPGIGHGDGDTITLVDGNTFLVGPSSGEISGWGVDGLYMLDTRVLSRWLLTIDDEPIEGISAVFNGPFSVSLTGRAANRGHVESDVAVLRRRHVGRGMREDLELRFFGLEPRTITVGLEILSDFASVFEVKAGHVTRVQEADVDLDGAVYSIVPIGGAALDRVEVTFDPPPADDHDGRLQWEVELGPGDTFDVCAEVAIVVGGDRLPPSHRCGQPVEEAIAVGRLTSWRTAAPSIETDDADLAQATRQAIEDLGALRIFDPDHADRVVVAAGAPWFMTLFGRDALITAWMALLVDHALAHGVLLSLADGQGRAFDADTEEEPGRILHEVRYDHHSARLLGGRNIYYGTVDATPLFVMLVAEMARWSGRTELVNRLLPAVDRAIAWIEQIGDRDGDGFVEYHRVGETGLANQGWKDSWDGIRHLDGRPARSPIALAEVQGYVHAAYRGRAQLATMTGDDVAREHWEYKAEAMRRRFEDRFWLPDRSRYAVGLDATNTPIDSLASNVGHCLWAGVVEPARAAAVADLLGSDGMFSGWGLRTLSADAHGFNPLSYHCGSVWPHDTAIAVAGLSRYGHDEAAARITRGLIDAAATGGGRLPELFAGFARDETGVPIPYPTSCSPQAWAAASPLLLLRSILGLEPDLIEGRVRLRPRLPQGMTRLAIDGVPIGGSRVSIDVGPKGVEVHGLDDGVELVVE